MDEKGLTERQIDDFLLADLGLSGTPGQLGYHDFDTNHRLPAYTVPIKDSAKSISKIIFFNPGESPYYDKVAITTKDISHIKEKYPETFAGVLKKYARSTIRLDENNGKITGTIVFALNEDNKANEERLASGLCIMNNFTKDMDSAYERISQANDEIIGNLWVN